MMHAATRTGRALGLGLLTAVMLGACGSSGRSSGGPAGAGRAPTTASSTPTQVEFKPGDEKALAQSLLIAPADLPAGWVMANHITIANAAGVDGTRASCLGLADPAAAYTALEASPDATAGGVSAQSSVALLTTPANAALIITKLKGSQGAACEKAALTPTLQPPAGATVEAASLPGAVLSTPVKGVEVIGFRFTSGGSTLDAVELHHDRAVVTVLFRFGPDAAGPNNPGGSTEQAIVARVVSKVAAVNTGAGAGGG